MSQERELRFYVENGKKWVVGSMPDARVSAFEVSLYEGGNAILPVLVGTPFLFATGSNLGVVAKARFDDKDDNTSIYHLKFKVSLSENTTMDFTGIFSRDPSIIH